MTAGLVLMDDASMGGAGDGQAVSERATGVSTGDAVRRSRLRQTVTRVLLACADALPGCCLLCGDPSGREALCPDCLFGLPPSVLACPRCALPRGDGVDACDACRHAPPPWASATAPLHYEFPVDRLVRALKFHGDFAAGAALSAAMVAGPRPRLDERRTPWIVPVPLHWTRECRRGFNQAGELALAVARYTGWPLAPRLRRVRRTAAQSGLDATARRRNLRDAFAWRGPSLAGQGIILVDDVLTTGSTAAACARALAGAAEVHVWVAARALPPEDRD
jgi:ComF family protein